MLRNGTRLDAQLTIHNSGTKEFTSLEIGKLALRVLAGAGEARLVEPAFPIHIDNLTPGAFHTIALTLDVPQSVKKLALSESGTVNNGESSPYRFSLGQVIFPNQGRMPDFINRGTYAKPINSRLAAIPAMAADIYTFTVPDAVTVESLAGLTTGWGYSLHNESRSLWLVTTGLSVSAFQPVHFSTPPPILLFDFPDLAPCATVTVPYDPLAPAGLYQIF